MERRTLALVVVAMAAWPCGVASAANANRPRTPVVWSDAPCATIVDQSVDPVVRMQYAVAVEEDPEARTPDEVEDSRTHQFFALGEQDLGEMPLWISQADIDRAKAKDPEVVALGDVDPEDILETTSRFSPGSWVRITPDDARVPITFAQAAMGVAWDTTGVAPGTYVVWGYTWEPLINLWVRRDGFVKVTASAAAIADAGPSIALLRAEGTIEAGSPYTVPGCVDAEPGTTVTLEWGESVGTTIAEWVVAVEDEPVDSGALTLAFVPPDEAAGKSIHLRATVTDASGRSYVAYTSSVLAVLPDPTPGDDDGGDGCRIAAPTDATAFGAWALLLLGLGLRKRRAVACRRAG